MKTDEFKELTTKLDRLTPHQRSILADRLHKIEHVHVVGTTIENRVSSKPVCPKCGHDHIGKWGSASGLQRYRCLSCHGTFNALTGTPLARLRHKDKWLEFSAELLEGSSVRQSARVCGVNRNTTLLWRHRFLALPEGQKATSLVGIAEADETYFLESFKGMKHGMMRAPHRRGSKAAKRGLSEEKIPVLICRDRTGNTSDCVLEKDDKKHLCEALKPLLASDAVLCTDSSKAMGAAAREIGITHRPINLSAGIRVIGKVYHIQNVNAYDSRLKQWMRRFHGVATHYLPNYLGWRRMLDRDNASLTPRSVLLAALGLSGDQQLITT